MLTVHTPNKLSWKPDTTKTYASWYRWLGYSHYDWRKNYEHVHTILLDK